MRRFKAFCVGALLFSHANPVLAFSWDDLWLRSDQQIEKLIESKSFDEAERRAESIEQKALIQYRAEAYDAAAELYGKNAQDYNHATAMVRAGQYQAAVDAYDQILADSPDYEDAMHNRKIAQQLADLQQQQDEGGEGQKGEEQGQQKNEQSSGDKSDNSQGRSSQQPKESDQSNDPSEGSEPDENDRSEEDSSDANQQEDTEQEEQTSSAGTPEKLHDEKQQAMDQWLQQVPDDPAGLLRARIIREHQRNYGSSTDRAQAW